VARGAWRDGPYFWKSYTIEHWPRKSMAYIDALNHYPLSRCMLIDTSRIGLLAPIKEAQQNDINVKRIFDLAEARNIDGHITDILRRDGILFKEINNDLQIIVFPSLRPQVIRKAHERERALFSRKNRNVII